jgi:hypothetical protein
MKNMWYMQSTTIEEGEALLLTPKVKEASLTEERQLLLVTLETPQ